MNFILENTKVNEINRNLTNINNIINNNVTNSHLCQNNLHQSNHNIIKQPDNYTLNVHNKDIRRGIVNPIYRQTLKKCININTRFRDNHLNTESNNFTINLPNTISKVISMRVVDYKLPKNLYNICSAYNNNAFEIDGNRIDISDGVYQIDTLVNEISNNLSEDNYISYNNNSKKITIGTNSHEDIDIELNFFNLDLNSCKERNPNNVINSNLTLGWILGFRGSYIEKNYLKRLEKLYDNNKDRGTTRNIECTYNAWNQDCIKTTIKLIEKFNPSDLSNNYVDKKSYTGEAPFGDQQGYYLLSVNDFRNNHNTSFISPFKEMSMANDNIIARLSNDQSVRTDVYFPERIYFSPTDINRLDIKLYDEYGRLVEMSNLDYSFVLELEVMYEN